MMRKFPSVSDTEKAAAVGRALLLLYTDSVSEVVGAIAYHAIVDELPVDLLTAVHNKLLHWYKEEKANGKDKGLVKTYEAAVHDLRIAIYGRTRGKIVVDRKTGFYRT